MRLFILCVLVISLSGCAGMLSRVITGTQDATVPQKVLTHNENMTTKGYALYTTALSKITENKADNKAILKIANLVDDDLARKSKAGEESKLATIGNTAVRMIAQPQIQKKVEEGVEWSKNMITAVAGGATGGTGIFGTMLYRLIKCRNRIKKEVLKNQIKTKAISEDPVMLKKVNEVAEHTEVAGIIT